MCNIEYFFVLGKFRRFIGDRYFWPIFHKTLGITSIYSFLHQIEIIFIFVRAGQSINVALFVLLVSNKKVSIFGKKINPLFSILIQSSKNFHLTNR